MKFQLTDPMKFQLTEKEVETALAWIDQHSKDHVMSYAGAIGGRWSYVFIPTSIGTIKKVRCACGAEEDVTDFKHF